MSTPLLATSGCSVAELTLNERAVIGVRAEIPYAEQVWAFRALVLNEALRQYQGNQCAAARGLGMHRNTFSRLLEELRARHLLQASANRRDYKKRPQRSH